MAQHEDIRWQQRFNNYKRALTQLKKFIDKGELNELEQQGLIKSFEYTYELGWNVVKDFLEFSGSDALIAGSRDAIAAAFKLGIIKDGEAWMQMLKDRNQTAHTYNQETADEISKNILGIYFHCFIDLKVAFENIINKQTDLF